MGRIIALSLTAMALLYSDQASAAFSVDLLEDGKGTVFVDGQVSQLLNAVLQVEPVSGVTAPAFSLPFLPSDGDVLLLETGGGPSDLLRFLEGTVYFFSDKDESDINQDTLSNVGIPPASDRLTRVMFNETVLQNENFDFLQYKPTEGPGFIQDVSYFITSDFTIPEPPSIVLLALGLVITGLAGWLHRRAAAAKDRFKGRAPFPDGAI